MKYKKLFAVMFLLFVIVNCTKKEEPKHTGPLQKITIGIQNSIISAPVIIAKEKGFFKKNGLDVTFKKYPSGKLALLGMLAGENQISTCAEMPIASYFEKGGYLLLSSFASSNNSIWILARKDKGINKPEDLIGKKIATQKNSAAHFFLHSFLINNFLHEKVETVFLPAVELAPALAEGKIDAYSIRDTFILEGKKLIGDENSTEFFAPEVYTQYFNLTGDDKFVKSNPESIEKILRSVSEATDYMYNNKEITIESITSFLGSSMEENIVKMFEEFNFELSFSKALLLTMENESQMLKNDKEQPETIPDFLEMFYFDAIKKVKPESISIIGYRHED